VASELIGAEDLAGKLIALAGLAANKEMKAAVKSALNPTLRLARANIAAISPGERAVHRIYTGDYVASGFAAKNIKSAVSQSRDKTRITAIAGPTKRAYYASQFFEVGTYKLPKHEWLTPAFEASSRDGVQLIANAMRKRIERIARTRAAGKGRGRFGGKTIA
jgi:hypothetical protein